MLTAEVLEGVICRCCCVSLYTLCVVIWHGLYDTLIDAWYFKCHYIGQLSYHHTFSPCKIGQKCGHVARPLSYLNLTS